LSNIRITQNISRRDAVKKGIKVVCKDDTMAATAMTMTTTTTILIICQYNSD
jgi:hypothetical protein